MGFRLETAAFIWQKGEAIPKLHQAAHAVSMFHSEWTALRFIISGMLPPLLATFRFGFKSINCLP